MKKAAKRLTSHAARAADASAHDDLVAAVRSLLLVAEWEKLPEASRPRAPPCTHPTRAQALAAG